MAEETKAARTLIGKVLSAKAAKTITVGIERIVPHPVYGKYIRRNGKILAHDEAGQAEVGDVVAVVSCRPISKRKVWTLVQVLEKRK